jgi:ectoine hydroxylase-related dioxygenase (phytanoyl-CoA dioxygenase family)
MDSYNNFYKNGYCIIKNYYPASFINNILYNLKSHFSFCAKIKKKKLINFNKPPEELISLFYDSSKKLPVVIDLLSYNKNSKIIKKLLKSNNYGFLNRGFGFRFDYPNRKKFLTQLHQDYHANLGSPNGLVFYTPITPVEKNSGPVVVYSESHKDGIRKIHIKKSYDKSTSYIISLKKDELSCYNKVKLYLEPGDLAIFDFRLLHESSKNLSNKVRISFSSRYLDFNDSVARKNKFAGGLQDGNFFEYYHSELVV